MKLNILSRRKGAIRSSIPSPGPDRGGSDETPQALGLGAVSLPLDENPDSQNGVQGVEIVESREELVARLRHQVRSGTYEVPVGQLVKILTALILRRR